MRSTESTGRASGRTGVRMSGTVGRAGRGGAVLGVWLALAGMVCGTGTAFAPTASASVTGPADGGSRAYDVADYDVKVDYEPGSARLRGDTEVVAEATEDLPEFGMDLALTARSVEIDGSPAQSVTQSDDGGITVVPRETIEKGSEFRVRVRYDGYPGKDNPSWVESEDGSVVTVLTPVGTWFPGNDDPEDKADFRLAATVPDGWTAVSSGREEPARQRGDRSTFRWRSTEPLPADAAILGVGKWDVERTMLGDGTPLTTVYSAGRKGEFEKYAGRQEEIMEFLAGKFGAYPYDTLVSFFLDSVDDTAPNFAGQGAVIFPNAESEKYFDSSVVAHELTHQWYGRLVEEGESRDLCLSECFATYAQWMWSEFSEGQDLDAKYRREIEKRKDDEEFWRGKLSEGEGVYGRGPFMVHALRRQIGDAAFEKVLKQWPARFAGKAPEWSAMEKLVQQVSGQDLEGFFHAWARSEGVPEDTCLWPGSLRPGEKAARHG